LCTQFVILFSSEYIYKTTAVTQFKMVNLPCFFLHNFFSSKKWSVATKNRKEIAHTK